ncbi:MAG: acetylxylan esterase [Dehalococcoidia bacterium]
MTSRQPEGEAFWEAIDRQLAAIPLDSTLDRDDFYSQPEWSIYRMSYASLGGYRLFAWLSVPQGSGPFPALLRMPDYGSVHDLIYTPLRRQAIVMNPTYRGQRNSDASFQAQYPGLLTEGIENPDSYIIRQVFADALRAVEALLEQNLAEVGTLAAIGSGLGGSLALAATRRHSRIKAVAVDTPLALGHPDVLELASAYPLGELHDYLRVHPHRRDTVLANSAVLDPVQLASQVAVPVLLSLGQRDRGQCPLAIGQELASRLSQCDLRVYDGAGEGGGHEHGVVQGQWLREQLGVS